MAKTACAVAVKPVRKGPKQTATTLTAETGRVAIFVGRASLSARCSVCPSITGRPAAIRYSATRAAVWFGSAIFALIVRSQAVCVLTCA